MAKSNAREAGQPILLDEFLSEIKQLDELVERFVKPNFSQVFTAN